MSEPQATVNPPQESLSSPMVLLTAAVFFAASVWAGLGLSRSLGGAEARSLVALLHVECGGVLPIRHDVEELIANTEQREMEAQAQAESVTREAEQLKASVAPLERSLETLKDAVKIAESEAKQAENQAELGPAEMERELKSQLNGLQSLQMQGQALKAAFEAEQQPKALVETIPGREIPADVATWEAAIKAQWEQTTLKEAAEKIEAATKLNTELAAAQAKWAAAGMPPDDREPAKILRRNFESAVATAQKAVTNARVQLQKDAEDERKKFQDHKASLEEAVKRFSRSTTP